MIDCTAEVVTRCGKTMLAGATRTRTEEVKFKGDGRLVGFQKFANVHAGLSMVWPLMAIEKIWARLFRREAVPFPS